MYALWTYTIGGQRWHGEHQRETVAEAVAGQIEVGAVVRLLGKLGGGDDKS